MDGPKGLQAEKRAEGAVEDFVLICATCVGLMEFLEIWDIVESVTYALSIRPIVGAPGLDPETWETTPADLERLCPCLCFSFCHSRQGICFLSIILAPRPVNRAPQSTNAIVGLLAAPWPPQHTPKRGPSLLEPQTAVLPLSSATVCGKPMRSRMNTEEKIVGQLCSLKIQKAQT